MRPVTGLSTDSRTARRLACPSEFSGGSGGTTGSIRPPQAKLCQVPLPGWTSRIDPPFPGSTTSRGGRIRLRVASDSRKLVAFRQDPRSFHP